MLNFVLVNVLRQIAERTHRFLNDHLYSVESFLRNTFLRLKAAKTVNFAKLIFADLSIDLKFVEFIFEDGS